MLSRALVLTLLGGALVQAPLAAQSLGLPVVNNGVPTGLNLAVDAGFSNADAGKATTLGASASLGIGFLGVTGTIARWNPKDGDGVWAPGVSGSLRLLGGPLIPLRVMAQAGVSHWTIGIGKTTHIPIGVGFAATIPSPGFAIKPWIAPRVDITRFSSPELNGTDTETRFGISGGIELALLNGLSIRASYDRVSAKIGKPSIFALGVGFAP
ncbi:MAG: hypothetical protein V4503_01895 [Gemmatimonadota bacterium]